VEDWVKKEKFEKEEEEKIIEQKGNFIFTA